MNLKDSVPSLLSCAFRLLGFRRNQLPIILFEKGGEDSIVTCFEANRDSMAFFLMCKEKGCLQLCSFGYIPINFPAEREGLK